MKYTKTERLNLYNEAEKYWGKIAQYDQCVEECAELIVAINKYKRKCLYNEYQNNPIVEDNLLEELADTFMCVEQLISYVGEDKLQKRLDEKLDKLAGQIEKQKANKK
ncbi:MAG: antitoxin [Clostridiales bacterium]|nr:antitoxin [Clostridiales bacterium]